MDVDIPFNKDEEALYKSNDIIKNMVQKALLIGAIQIIKSCRSTFKNPEIPDKIMKKGYETLAQFK